MTHCSLEDWVIFCRGRMNSYIFSEKYHLDDLSTYARLIVSAWKANREVALEVVLP